MIATVSVPEPLLLIELQYRRWNFRGELQAVRLSIIHAEVFAKLSHRSHDLFVLFPPDPHLTGVFGISFLELTNFPIFVFQSFPEFDFTGRHLFMGSVFSFHLMLKFNLSRLELSLSSLELADALVSVREDSTKLALRCHDLLVGPVSGFNLALQFGLSYLKLTDGLIFLFRVFLKLDLRCHDLFIYSVFRLYLYVEAQCD